MGMGYRPSALIVATMETEHFTFTSCGATFDSARNYMLATWLHHLAQCGTEPGELTTVEALDQHYGINTMRVFPGLGMRDGQQIWTKDQ